MPDLASNILSLLDRKETAALATVVRAEPGSGVVVGGKLLLRPDQEPEGGTGHAGLDAAIQRDVDKAFESDEDNCLLHFQVEGSEARSLGHPHPGQELEVGAAGNVDVYVEVFWPTPRLIICGAGHIAVPLCRMAGIAGFEVVVVDDRELFANRQRFPDADEVYAADFVQALRGLRLDQHTYLVLVTRGHAHDEGCLREVLGAPVRYLGMIGSRRRVSVVINRLRQEGVAEELLERVHSPIGLDIGAVRPEEIAVAILAELIKARRGGSGRSLSELWRPTPESVPERRLART